MKKYCRSKVFLSCFSVFVFLLINSFCFANEGYLITNLSKLDCLNKDKVERNIVQIVDPKVRVTAIILNSEKFSGNIKRVGKYSKVINTKENKICLLSGVTTKGEPVSGIFYSKNSKKILKITVKSKNANRVNSLVTLKTSKSQLNKTKLNNIRFNDYRVSSASKSLLKNKDCNENGKTIKDKLGPSVNSLSITNKVNLKLNTEQKSLKAIINKLESKPGYTVKVSTEGDSKFANSIQDPMEEMVRLINDASVVYQLQLGVRLLPNEVTLYADPSSDPYSGINDADDLLNKFNSVHRVNNAGVYHLFTGNSIRDLTLGIAYVATACKSFASGLSRYVGGNIAVITVAHEIGHNFGATHDLNPVLSIMSTQINVDDPIVANPRFSQFSINEIESYIEITAPIYNQCFKYGLIDVPVFTITPTATPSPTPTQDFDLGGLIDTDDELIDEQIEVKTKIPAVKIKMTLNKIKRLLTVQSQLSKPSSNCIIKFYYSTTSDNVTNVTNLISTFSLNKKNTLFKKKVKLSRKRKGYARYQILCEAINDELSNNKTSKVIKFN